MKTFVLASLAAYLVSVDAMPQYVSSVPNGANVNGVAAIGHTNPSGGGARNSFGTAFATAGHEWTKELCEADSDGDGQTNGQELGDPCCTWTVGGTPQYTTGVSAPGDATSMADSSLWASISCSGSSSNSSTPSSSNSSTPSTTTATPSTTTATPSTTTATPTTTTAAPTSAANVVSLAIGANLIVGVATIAQV